MVNDSSKVAQLSKPGGQPRRVCLQGLCSSHELMLGPSASAWTAPKGLFPSAGDVRELGGPRGTQALRLSLLPVPPSPAEGVHISARSLSHRWAASCSKASGEARLGLPLLPRGPLEVSLLGWFCRAGDKGGRGTHASHQECGQRSCHSPPCSLFPRAPPPAMDGGSGRRGKEGERLERDIPWAEAM